VLRARVASAGNNADIVPDRCAYVKDLSSGITHRCREVESPTHPPYLIEKPSKALAGLMVEELEAATKLFLKPMMDLAAGKTPGKNDQLAV